MLYELLVAIIIALILTVPLAALFGRRRPWHVRSGVWPFHTLIFLVLFFATWTGGVWASADALARSAIWLPILALVLLVAMLVAVLVLHKESNARDREAGANDDLSRVASLAKRLVWVILAGLVVAIVTRYVLIPQGNSPGLSG